MYAAAIQERDQALAQAAELQAQLGKTQHALEKEKEKRKADVDQAVSAMTDAGIPVGLDPTLGVSARAKRARETFGTVVQGKREAEARADRLTAKQKEYSQQLGTIIISARDEGESESEKLAPEGSEENPLAITRRISAIGKRDKKQREKIH